MILLIPIAFVFIGWLLFGNKTDNPYIRTHQRKWENDKNYRDYLKWLDKQGGDSPLNKAEFKEDVEIMDEVSKHINR